MNERQRLGSRHITKICPECGKDMVVRKNRETGESFLGCSRWPDCKHSEPLPTHLILEAQGAARLPGF